MSDSVQNSATPPRNFPKSTLSLDSASYMGLDLSNYDIDDDVVLIIRGRIKEKAVSMHEKGERSVRVAVIDVQDQTPREDRDITNRLT